METQNFDLNKVKTLSPMDAKLYVDKYFIPLTDGNHALYVNGKYEILEDTVVKKTYFKRMSSELNKYYFTEKTDLKTIAYNINKPCIYDNYLNLCPRIKQIVKPLAEFSKDAHTKLNIILAYMKEVLCSSNNEAYLFLLKWLSNMVHGNRNNSALYLKGPQGCGKSTLLEFIRKFVLGNDLCFQGGSGPLRNKFNSELSGKLMVVFEELENFSSSEWISISSVLKRQITSPTLDIERKGQDVREETNLNNYILISNNDAIQDDDGRRYDILDISTKYIGNKEYFNKLYSCFDDNIGQLFYSYLMEIDLKGYDAQAYPMTKSKLDSFSKRLDNVFKFLKDEYVLSKKEIDRMTVQNLYDRYIAYCSLKQLKVKSKIDFNNTLSDVGIKWKKSNGQNVYKVTLDELINLSNKFHWVHELDEYNEENDDCDEYENGIDKSDKSINVKLLLEEKIELLEDVNDDMMRYIKRLENMVHMLDTKSINNDVTNEYELGDKLDNLKINNGCLFSKKVVIEDSDDNSFDFDSF